MAHMNNNGQEQHYTTFNFEPPAGPGRRALSGPLPRNVHHPDHANALAPKLHAGDDKGQGNAVERGLHTDAGGVSYFPPFNDVRAKPLMSSPGTPAKQHLEQHPK